VTRGTGQKGGVTGTSGERENEEALEPSLQHME
jgi:hypothetical protein